MPLRLFRSQERSDAYAARMLYLRGMIGFFYFTTQFMQDGLGFTPLQAGLGFLPARPRVAGPTPEPSGPTTAATPAVVAHRA